MDCRQFELSLDDLASGRLPAAERGACQRHADGCTACGELLALATLAADVVPAQLAASILARTSGAICERVAPQVPELVDGELAAGDRELVAGHVAGCAECAALAAALEGLAREMPRLAEVRPDAGFVEAVLRRTLPLSVQLRRWWQRTWPRWLRRPRFASEAAYIGSLVLVLVFATPGSPLEAVPQRALGVVRQPVVGEAGIAEALEGRLAAARELVGDSSRSLVDTCLAAGSRSFGQAMAMASGLGDDAATLWQEAASLLERDGDDAAPESSTEENP
jgi:anti-sigma factor RsiW